MADYFAVCMLMPKQWVQQRRAEVRGIDLVAETFEVPEPAMWPRLCRLNLVD